MLPSAARGNATSWAPESGVLMDSNAGDYFPSFIRMNGIDHIVLFGRADAWSVLRIKGGEIEFLDGTPYLGLDNMDLRDRVQKILGRPVKVEPYYNTSGTLTSLVVSLA